MIGSHKIDDTFSQGVPQLFAIVAFTDGRRAFEVRGPVGDFLGAKGQVVRASLDSDRQPFGACVAEHRHSARRREMNDMHPRTVLAAEPDHQRNRIVLGGRWTSPQVAGVDLRRCWLKGQLHRRLLDGIR